ncbi:MAG: diaminopimelate epimerase [Bacteroidaceae bacterium]|nr:diaminopimelate epimerase [Bacteroidaceae bacterium]
MAQKVHFAKMHGAGNDYIYVDTLLYNIEDPAALARAWSDRHKGIGSDGLVLIGRSPIPEADFTMNIFNADGSEAMMCGNASRCIGKYLFEKGLTVSTRIRLLTLSGIKVLNLHLAPSDTIVSGKGKTHSDIPAVESVTVDMGAPVMEDVSLFHPNSPTLPAGYFVSMGNPHYVIFVNDIDSVDIATEGSALENHAAFPQRANIEFAEMRPDGIRVRVWERGSGITMACGTGACATAVAAAVSKRSGRSSHIIMDGGSLDIEWKEDDNHVYMTGGATLVYEGDIPIEQL